MRARAPRTCLLTSSCWCELQAWSQLHTQGLSKPLQPQPALAHACGAAAGWCSVCLCLQRHLRTHAPSATMKKNRVQLQPAAEHAWPLLWLARRCPHRQRDCERIGTHSRSHSLQRQTQHSLCCWCCWGCDGAVGVSMVVWPRPLWAERSCGARCCGCARHRRASDGGVSAEKACVCWLCAPLRVCHTCSKWRDQRSESCGGAQRQVVCQPHV
jgi:hypothetical protein